jgi:hypothetical protein
MPSRTGWSAPSQSRFRDESDDDDNFVRRSQSHRRNDDRNGNSDRSRGGVKEEKFDGFSANGRGLGRRSSPDPLVIAPQPNKDWREAKRAGAPSYRPAEQTGPVITHERTGDEPQRAGLRFLKREPGDDVKREEVKREEEPAEEDIKPSDADLEERKPLTLEERALQAVLAGDTEGATASAVPADFTISTGANARSFPTDEDALRRDLAALPQESNLDDYDAVPIEAFGAAILRGMGYNPANDTKVHVPKPRPALLGLGATALSAELPPTSKKKDPKKRKEAYATRGGRGFNASNLLVKSGTNTPRSDREIEGRNDRDVNSREPERDSRNGTPDDRRRRRDDDDDDGRDAKRRDDRRDRDRRDDRRYETEEERARRKARERERDRDRDYRRDDRSRRDDRDRRDDRERRDDRRDSERDRDRNRDDRRDRERDRDRERERERERERDRR